MKWSKLFRFVSEKHEKQRRKYTDEPYINHLLNVVEAVKSKSPNSCIEEIALCHDLLEDTNTTDGELNAMLTKIGYSEAQRIMIISGVIDLTDVYTHEDYPDINREQRKKKECERLSRIDPVSQTVKYADLIDNTETIVQYDLKFAKIYLQEKESFLKSMTEGDKELYRKAWHVLKEAQIKLHGKTEIEPIANK